MNFAFLKKKKGERAQSKGGREVWRESSILSESGGSDGVAMVGTVSTGWLGSSRV